MGLDGLRAWIGEVERKVGMRTKVMLALATIAIGLAGAGIYLAIDTRDNAVSETDVQELQQQLESQIGAGGATGTATDATQLESELRALQAEVEELRAGGGASGQGKGTGGGGASGGAGGGAGAGTGGASGGDVEDLSKKLQELAEGAAGQPK